MPGSCATDGSIDENTSARHIANCAAGRLQLTSLLATKHTVLLTIVIHDGTELKTFSELYCFRCNCSPEQFHVRLFWRTLPLSACIWVPFLGGRTGRFFAADRELIADAARAHTMKAVKEAVYDFFMHADTRRFLGRFLHVRVSTKKLKHLAREYLPESL